MTSTTSSAAGSSLTNSSLSITPLGMRTEQRSLLDLWNPKKGSIAHSLASEPQAFDFFPAVMLIESISSQEKASNQSIPDRPIGRFYRLDQEAVRFSAPATSAFPTAQIESIAIDKNQQPRMLVNFMGLTGPSGMLPRTYTHLLAQTSRDGRGEERYALRDFLDQFNHRLVSLFYVAWTKYRFPVRIDKGGAGNSLFEVALSASGGLTDPKSEQQSSRDSQISKSEILAFAGLLSQHPTTAGNLESVLNRVLNLPVRVLQFQASVLELDESSQTCLGVENGCGQLGLSAVVGPRTRTRQHKIAIEVGPIDFRDMDAFLPGEQPGLGYLRVAEIVRKFVGHSLEYDLQLQVYSLKVDGSRLETFEQTENDVHSGSRLGFDSWLHSDAFPEILEDAVIPGAN